MVEVVVAKMEVEVVVAAMEVVAAMVAHREKIQMFVHIQIRFARWVNEDKSTKIK
ncbi:hypothetical protein ZOSMA_91G00700 [Zostera marina]|uniref:Uncharacterized protein n=1 Tax=Zostera marina TaxID=29655 RepID=A0A0K9NJ59_ZOSMR|nr:hypothetical protein ZOSMA_91G00700 [Zostera marina]